MEGAVSERRKAFSAAHRSDVDCQAYISAFRRASSVIAKAKAEAWQTTCSSLSPKSNPKSVYSLLCSIVGSRSSFSSSPNFPNCSSPRESASVYAAYMRSHFSVFQPKTLRSKARGYLSELRRATFLEESYSFFCSPFSLIESFAAASNLPIHKMGKPLESPASFRPISLTSCVSELFERILLSRLLIFLGSNFFLSPRQAGFRPGRSTLDQILFFF